MNEMELQTTLDPIEMDMGDPEIVYSPVLPNPEGDPTDDLTKVQIQGNIYKVKDPEVHDWARAEEKPTYTKEEVGLGNVDDTSDMDKPVSTATQTALDNKVDKVAGKGLSTNDFTNDFKTKLEGIEPGAEVNTVNSVAGKTGNVTLNKSDVGLGNVDNTSDMNKPVSTATQTALNGKVDNSTLNNYYTKTQTDSALSLKANSSSVYTKTEADNLLNGKVDKIEGKGLSENDFTDALKSKLDGIEAEANKTIVDNALDGTSANPVENRVVKSALDEKLNADETAFNSNGLVIATPVTDTAPYIYRQTPVKYTFKALMKKIVGASVVWNQLIKNGNFTDTSEWVLTRGTLAVANNIGTYTITEIGASATQNRLRQAITGLANHKYIMSCGVNSPHNSTFTFMQVQGTTAVASKSISIASGWQTVKTILAPSSEFNEQWVCVDCRSGFELGEEILLKNVYLIDLTAMFGTTIADYVYTLETSQSGSGIAWLQSYGFFTEDYYAYKQNKLESGCVSAHKTYDGETLLTNTELSPITLRGLFKLSTDKLTVDGDEYNADGSVTRKCSLFSVLLSEAGRTDAEGETYTRYRFNISNVDIDNRTLSICDNAIYNNGGGEYTHFNINSSGNYVYLYAPNTMATSTRFDIIYPLETPTTEQTTPFTETEIVGSTEEFIDYEVAQGNRDVAIPVGTETDYYQEMKLPPLPTTSGNHNLIYNPESGFGWS